MEGSSFRNIRNVELVRERAAIGARIVATLLDYLVFIAYTGILLTFPPTRELIRGSPTFSILFFLPLLFYHLLCELFFDGQSAGKYAMGTRVMRVDGDRPTLGNYLLRWIFRLFDMQFSWSVGVLSVVLTEKGQRVGDLAADTVVIKERPPLSIKDIWSDPDPDARVNFEEAGLLTDKEVALLKEALDRSKKSRTPVDRLTQRIVQRTGINSDLPPDALARTLIEDHDKLFRKGKAG